MKIRDTLKSECVLSAIIRYLEAKQGYDACAADCDYSADYHCRSHVGAMEDAAVEFDKAIRDLIASPVSEDEERSDTAGPHGTEAT